MASIQGDSGVTDFGVISSRPGFMLHAEIQGKQVLVPVSGLAEGLGDKFLLMQGKDNGLPGHYAIGYGSKTYWNKKNQPHYEDYLDPILFTATATYEGVTQTYEDIAAIFIDHNQGASASVTYGGKVFEIPSAPEGSGFYQTGFVVFPEVPNAVEEFGLPQLAPVPGMKVYMDAGYGGFEVISAEKVEGGWGVILGLLVDEELGPVEVVDDFDGLVELDAFYDPEWVDDDQWATSVAMGTGATAGPNGGIAIGNQASASEGGIAIGKGAIASGDYYYLGNPSVAIGTGCKATGFNCYALGNQNIASGGDYYGYTSFALGYGNKSTGADTFALGRGLIASGSMQMVTGGYNVEDSTKAFIIGGGRSGSGRKNIFTIDPNGKPDSAQIPSVNGGDLVVLGIVPPAAKPAFAGQIYLDANNKKLYVAKAATATTDWVAIN